MRYHFPCTVGSHGGEKASLVVNALSSISNLEDLEIASFSNVSASNATSPLNQIYTQKLQKNCQGNLCFGTSQTTVDAPTLHWVQLLASQSVAFAERATFTSSASRYLRPFWLQAMSTVYQGAKDSGSWVVRAIGSRLDSVADRVTDKIVAYASEVVEATPHYHTPGLWVYDEEGEIIGTTEGFGMRTLDDGVNLDRQGCLSGRLPGHLESQSVCLIPSSGIGGLASSAPVPLISGGGY